jgi:tryptophanyl-tRNA synthetase
VALGGFTDACLDGGHAVTTPQMHCEEGAWSGQADKSMLLQVLETELEDIRARLEEYRSSALQRAAQQDKAAPLVAAM